MNRAPRRLVLPLALMALAILTDPARSEIRLPPGFAKEVYVTGQGFATGRGSRGHPCHVDPGLRPAGSLFLARTGARYQDARRTTSRRCTACRQAGRRLTPDTEARFLYGPPLRNVQATAVRGGLELFVTTFDRDRRLGVRLPAGRRARRALRGRHPAPERRAPAPPAGGRRRSTRPDTSTSPIGNRAPCVLLDPSGRVLDPRYVAVQRPRVLAIDASDTLWIGADGNAEAPWQQGPGEIWRVPRDGTPALLLRGPMPAAIAASPGGHLLVADRQGSELFALTPDGQRIPFVSYTQGDAPRGPRVRPGHARHPARGRRRGPVRGDDQPGRLDGQRHRADLRALRRADPPAGRLVALTGITRTAPPPGARRRERRVCLGRTRRSASITPDRSTDGRQADGQAGGPRGATG